MNTRTILFLLLATPATLLPGQETENCKVMVPALQGTYNGGCKNGLAQGKGTARGTDSYTGYFKKGYPHGHGIYTWMSGDSYSGDWTMGMREGEGTFKGAGAGKDTVLAGIWKNDRYIGPKPEPPYIIQKYNIASVSFNRNGEGNKIAISFFQNGMINNIEALQIVTNSGTENQTGAVFNVWDIMFPFHCKINYTSWNSLRTVQYNSVLEFEISQPGSWDLRIVN